MTDDPRIETIDDYYNGYGTVSDADILMYIHLKNNLVTVTEPVKLWGTPLPASVQTSDATKTYIVNFSALVGEGKYQQALNLLLANKAVIIDDYFYFEYSWLCDCIRCLSLMGQYANAAAYVDKLIVFNLPDIIDNAYADPFSTVYYFIDRTMTGTNKYFCDTSFKPYVSWLLTATDDKHKALITVTEWLSEIKRSVDSNSVDANTTMDNFKSNVVQYLPIIKTEYKHLWDLCRFYVINGPQVKKYTVAEMLSWFN